MSQSLRSHANAGRFSVALILSYVLDWIIIIAVAAVGAVFSIVTPNKRPFSLTDAEISFPHVSKETVSVALLGVVAFVLPAGIIFFMCLLLVPGPTVPKSTPKALIWRRKLWECHTGWLGLALSLAVAFFVTSGIKNVIGKPRPDLLSRCGPDLANIAKYTFGNFSGLSENHNVVSAAICQQTDKLVLDDGFRSFPSGHASFASAGLIYLSLFVASKLAITIPFLAPSQYSQDGSRLSAFPSRAEKPELEMQHTEHLKDGEVHNEAIRDPSGHNDEMIAARNQAAAPPVYLLVIAAIPSIGSIYIASTRYSDFRHHGFDILFGYLLGIITAVFAFRYYHLPLSQGAGWSWRPRSQDRSFWAGVGVGNYVGSNPSSTTARDIELAAVSRRGTNDVGVVRDGHARP